MRLSYLALAVVACLSAGSASAVSFDGRSFDESKQVNGDALILNGLGKRSLLVFAVYYALLYLPARQHSFEAVKERAPRRQLEVHLLRDVNLSDIEKVFVDGINQNVTPAEMQKLSTSMEELLGAMRKKKSFRKGDVLQFVFDGETTRILINAVQFARPIAGKPFNDALLSIWLGPKPVDRSLRARLLGLTE